MKKRVFLGVTSGMAGYFAVLYDADGPIQTGLGRYATPKEAAHEAVAWEQSEGVALMDAATRSLATGATGEAGT